MVGLIGFGVTSVAIAVAPTAELRDRAARAPGRGRCAPRAELARHHHVDVPRPGAGTAIGTWTAWTSASFLLGPILGGISVDTLSWRLVFAINVIPIALRS